MKSNCTLVLVLFFCSLLQACASSGGSAFDELTPWVGQRPFHKVEGKALWQTTVMENSLKKSLGSEGFAKFNKIAKNGPSGEVEKYQDHLFLSVCQAHNCHNVNYQFIVDLKKELVHLCWSTEESRKKGIVYWSNGKGNSTAKTDCVPKGDKGLNHDAAYFKKRLSLIPF